MEEPWGKAAGTGLMPFESHWLMCVIAQRPTAFTTQYENKPMSEQCQTRCYQNRLQTNALRYRVVGPH